MCHRIALQLLCCVIALPCVATVANAAPTFADDAIPSHPRDIQYPPLTFTPPNASEFRRTLSDGTVVFMAPDKTFPLISLSVSAMGGQNMVGADSMGLAGLAASQMRAGGTERLTPSEVDETLDFMASSVGISGGSWASGASLNTLASNFDSTLSLMMDMLRAPRFDSERLRIAKETMLEGLKQRNDDADSIAGYEWRFLIFGEDTWRGAQPNADEIMAMDESAMRDISSQIFRSGNTVVTVSGDFDPDAMMGTLEKAFVTETASRPRNPAPEADQREMPHGLYHAQKDIPQGKVFVGGRSLQREDPDAVAATLMNEILGGGFTSRITRRVRSDEGLAYSAGSGFKADPFALGTIHADVQSKNATVALSTKLILEEFAKMRDTLVTEEELATAKKSFIETFPQTFGSKAATVAVFADDEMTNRPSDWWDTYRDRVNTVTREDIQRVAQRLLQTQHMSVLVVGDWEEIAPGDENGRASMQDIEAVFGPVQHLPPRDPLSLKPQ
ncbi:MAG: pitrilysin family protein [Planctomycetota bacterium]|nr:pitrilysin family protein [Planctomycetota bacterium]MDA1105702.1 pitrilysin family protein [Planctomycetota bacterium]